MARLTERLYDWCMMHGEIGQRIIEEFVGSDIENGDEVISDESWSEWADIMIENSKIQIMNEYTAFSNIEVWWQCKECNKYYKNKISNRVRLKYGCQKCSVKHRVKVHKENGLKVGENDFLTWCQKNGVYGEKLIDEWMEDKNSEELGITMDSINYGTNTKAYFKCRKCGDVSMKAINSLVNQKSGCRKCSVTGTSLPEQLIYYAVKQVFEDALNRELLFDGYEYDIVIPSEKVCIEYNGIYYHGEYRDRDKIKKELCIENGYRLFVINDDCAYKNKDIIYSGDDIRFAFSGKYANNKIREIVKYIVELLGKDVESIDFKKAMYDAECVMYRPLKNNVLKQYPEIEKEFDASINNGLDLKYFTYGSFKYIKWKCCKCKHVWGLEIYTRVKRKGSCPNCNYNIFRNEYVRKKASKKYIDSIDRWKL